VLGIWGAEELASFQAMVKPWEDKTGGKMSFTGTRDLTPILATRVEGNNAPDIAIPAEVGLFRRSLLAARSAAFVGIDNYRWIIQNPEPLIVDTHSALFNNAMWLVLFTAVTVPLGLVLAVLTGHVRYEAVAKSAVFIPMAISFVAAPVIWRFMLEFNAEIGTLNAVATSLGAEPTAWLQNTGSSQVWLTQRGPDELPERLQFNNFALVVVGVWMWTGFAMVVLSAGLRGVSTEILEAARVDGASEWQVF